MLGGFSATIIYRILIRLIHAIESLVSEDTEATRELVARAQKSEIEALDLSRKNQLIKELIPLDLKVRDLLPEEQRETWSNLLSRYVGPPDSAIIPAVSVNDG